MKRTMLVTALTSSFIVGGAASRMAEPAVDSHDRAGVVTSFGPIESHHGRFRAEVVEYTPLEQASGGTWVVRLETAGNRRIAHGEVLVSAFMPEDAAVVGRDAVARYIGDGRYEISGLDFNRAGWWNVGLVVGYRGQVDSLAFNLLLSPRADVEHAR